MSNWRTRAIQTLWDNKHADYRSEKGSKYHHSILDYQEGTVIVPLEKASDEDLRGLLKKNRLEVPDV